MSENPSTTEAPKRKARTLEEREAALEAELAKVRQQAKTRSLRKLEALEVEYAKLNDQLQALQTKRAVLFQEISELRTQLKVVDSD